MHDIDHSLEARGAPLADGPALRTRLPVSVVMRITPTPANPWRSERRETVAVVARGPSPGPAAATVSGTGGSEAAAAGDEASNPAEPDAGAPIDANALPGAARPRLQRFDRLAMSLHRDEAENYFQNLSTGAPRCFVVMTREDADRPLEPFIVTVCPDLAASYESVDHVVDAVALDASLHGAVEAFTLTHYIPEKMRKRKRRNWSEDEPSRGSEA